MVESVITADVARWTASALQCKGGCYYDGYYYMAYLDSSNNIDYNYSSDKSSWTEALVTASADSKSLIHIHVFDDKVWVVYCRANKVYTKAGTQQGDGSLSFSSEYEVHNAKDGKTGNVAGCTTTNRFYIFSSIYDGSRYRIAVSYTVASPVSFTNIMDDSSVLGGSGYPPNCAMCEEPDNGDDSVMFIASKRSSAAYHYNRYDGSSWGGWTDTGYNKTANQYGRVGIHYYDGKCYLIYHEYRDGYDVYLGIWTCGTTSWDAGGVTVNTMTGDKGAGFDCEMCSGDDRILFNIREVNDNDQFVEHYDVGDTAVGTTFTDTGYAQVSSIFLASSTICRMFVSAAATISFADDVKSCPSLVTPTSSLVPRLKGLDVI